MNADADDLARRALARGFLKKDELARTGASSSLVIPGYAVTGVIGRGGMGLVLGARAADGSDVAIKVLTTASSGAPERFLRERRLLGDLAGAGGFVPVLASGETDQGPFFVMPLVDGGTLRDRLARGALPVGDAVALGRKLAAALARAHAAGIVHRDLKPENVLFTREGEPLVADLGLAKHFTSGPADAAASVVLSRTGEFRGTVSYAPPEQVRDSKSVGPAADVFALGAILYEALAGKPAFEGETLTEVLVRLESGEHDSLSVRRPDAPAWLVAVVERALAGSRRERYPDAQALLRALESEGRAGDRSRARLAGLAALAVVALGLAGALAWPGVTRRAPGASSSASPGDAPPLSPAPLAPALLPLERRLAERAWAEKDPDARRRHLADGSQRCGPERFLAAVADEAERGASAGDPGAALAFLELASPSTSRTVPVALARARARLLLARAGKRRRDDPRGALEDRALAFEADPREPSPLWYPGLAGRRVATLLAQLETRPGDYELGQELLPAAIEALAEGTLLGWHAAPGGPLDDLVRAPGVGREGWLAELVLFVARGVHHDLTAALPWSEPRRSLAVPPRLARLGSVLERRGPEPAPRPDDGLDLVLFACAPGVADAERARAFERAHALALWREAEVVAALALAPEDEDLVGSLRFARSWTATVETTWARELDGPFAATEADPIQARVEKLGAARARCPLEREHDRIAVTDHLIQAHLARGDFAAALDLAAETDREPATVAVLAARCPSSGPALDVLFLRGRADLAVTPPRLEDADLVIRRLVEQKVETGYEWRPKQIAELQELRARFPR